MPCAKFIICGRVQGVFFRASTRTEATRLGLDGYAKNLADGSVEVLACGDAAALDALHRWLQRGPRDRRRRVCAAWSVLRRMALRRPGF